MKRFLKRHITTSLLILAAALSGVVGCEKRPETDYSANIGSVGVRVSEVGDIVFWKIPLAQTAEADKRIIFDRMLEQFADGMGQVNSRLRANGVSLPLMSESEYKAYGEQTESLIRRIIAAGQERDIAAMAGDYSQMREMGHWKSYLIPQAFIVYGGGQFKAAFGGGAGFSAIVYVVIQPWLKVGIDKRTAKQVSSSVEMNMTILGVPNLDAGVGVGGGGAAQAGVGVVWGPLQTPDDMAGLGIGATASASMPIVGGGSARVIGLLRNPPLVYAVAGYQGGVDAGMHAQLSFQALLSLDKFMAAILSSAGMKQ